MTNTQFQQLWVCFGQAVSKHKDELNQLDAAIGDADHGTNLDRGLQQVLEKMQAASPATLQATCKLVAMTLLSTVGGASGALWGSGLLAAAKVFPDTDTCDDKTLTQAIQAFVDSIEQRGKAVVGDKTMLDVFVPALSSLAQDAEPITVVVPEIAAHAKEWAEATASLQAKKGRAAYLGPRSVGHIDPGATSSALWWQCLGRIIGGSV
ncbi:dihydroxyacetone kinase subunit L [Sulfobacillus thermotolerans]|uniref:Dihydroxyacetone kinase subunit L n=1 Tax=Sulfobacillus thermotolerans TaxID=338644 RepID=A0ABM6RS95_9FIRM|nr:dihydroxyacetone kinase subunit L [Sulfobacillus thermotolerans]